MRVPFPGAVSAVILAIVTAALLPRSARADEAEFALLLFTKTAGYRHKSIGPGVEAIKALGSQYGFRVDHTEDAAVFSDSGLAPYSVVMFLNTSGDILQDAEQAAFERFIRRGHGFVGVHSATDTEYDWPWYGELIGGYFLSHPAIQRATLNVNRADPATAHLPVRWTRTDEWYNFRSELAPEFEVLLGLDELSYSGGRMGANHPLAWHHLYDGGRAWYTGLGHTEESYSEPAFLLHLLGGIQWAAGRIPR
jgi:cytochrome c